MLNLIGSNSDGKNVVYVVFNGIDDEFAQPEDQVYFNRRFTARWIKDKNNKLYRCSRCRAYAPYAFANSKVWDQWKSKVCPGCGAIMEEVK